MPKFLREKNIEFQLANLDVVEDVSIWCSYDKRNQQLTDIKGNVLKFPIRSGILIGNDGKERDFEDLKNMPTVIFRQLYPDLNITRRYLRTVIVSGVEMYYHFSKTANNQLENLFETLKTANVDPLTVTFKQTYFPSNTPQQKYKIEVVTATAKQPQTPLITGKIKLDSIKENTLTEKEEQILKALKSLDRKLTSEQVNKVCLDNDVRDPERIKILWEAYSHN